MSKLNLSKKAIAGVVSFLLFAALLAFQGFSDKPYSFQDNSQIDAYNEAIESINSEDADPDIILEALRKVERLSDPGTFVAVAAEYNVAYRMVTHPDADIASLRAARSFLVKALRIESEDEDIRKNLELITAVLVQEVQQKLQEEGMAEQEAEQTAKRQEMGDIPSKGDDASRGGGSENDY